MCAHIANLRKTLILELTLLGSRCKTAQPLAWTALYYFVPLDH